MTCVSAIIPTRNRPVLLERAIRSVLDQTFQQFEILVVIDGPDDLTDPEYLRSLDPRIKVLSLPANVGLAEARNCGIRAAIGEWVALLDDDDEWLPAKLAAQVKKARSLQADYVFIPCRFIEKTTTCERLAPVKLPSSTTNFSEYIYCEGGYLQPSVYFMSWRLAMEVPFTAGLRHVEDTDWLLRVTLHPKVIMGSVEEPLSIYNNQKDGSRESETTPWAHPLKWATENHQLFTPKAFSFFVARLCVNARRSSEPVSVLLRLLVQAHRFGTLTPKAVAYFLAYWFLPADTLKKLRSGRDRRKHPTPGLASAMATPAIVSGK